MKKIILCMALSVLFLFGSIASFLVNDVAAMAGWASRNYPRMADQFDRHLGRFAPDRPRPPRPPREAPRERSEQRSEEGEYSSGEKHHMRRPTPPPRMGSPGGTPGE